MALNGTHEHLAHGMAHVQCSAFTIIYGIMWAWCDCNLPLFCDVIEIQLHLVSGAHMGIKSYLVVIVIYVRMSELALGWYREWVSATNRLDKWAFWNFTTVVATLSVLINQNVSREQSLFGCAWCCAVQLESEVHLLFFLPSPLKVNRGCAFTHVCLLVCEHDISKSWDWIWTKFVA